jgi:hypothetical protein
MSEPRHFHLVPLELVIPSETVAVCAAERGRAGGDFHHAGFRHGTGRGHGKRGRYFPIERQMVQHVGEGFGVHQAMFDGHVQQFLRDIAGSPSQARIQIAAHTRIVTPHLFGGRPIRGLVRGQIGRIRIDAKRKQPVEPGMKCRHIQRAAQQVPIERLQMAEVEYDAMPFRNGALVQRRRIDQIEEAVGLRTCPVESLAQFRVRCHLRCHQGH